MGRWSRIALASAVVVAASALAAVPSGASGDRASSAPAGAGHRPGSPTAAGCDPLDPSLCLLPFPDNYFTVADPSSPTGLRLHFTTDQLPSNVSGVPIDPTDWNRSDGFSPGSLVMTLVPGIDLQRSGLAPITDIGRSLAPSAPAVLLDTVTRQRVPYWAELDTWNNNPATRALVIRPARDFTEGHRIVVALRDLRDSSGATIPASAAFAAFRDHEPREEAEGVRSRRPSMERVFADLARSGVERQDLYLAWDFTVASEQGLAGGMLHMRDDAYAQLGAGVPSFTVTHVDANVSSDVLRRVEGTFDVPNYLTGTGAPGSRLVLGPNGLPTRNGTFHADFRCLIPRSTLGTSGGAQAARGVVYGHGLLGDPSEIESFGPLANKYRLIICATPEIGLSSGDLGNVAKVISDLSTFGSIPDRLQQGILNFQFLARLLKEPRGFASNPAFQVGTPPASAIVPNQVFFNGNSQGGILGGAVTAISKEWTRAVLGVPAINYSELLPRSVDFDRFLPLLSAAYPDQRLHTLGVGFMQILWDRGESDGYAQHLIHDPYPNTPNHTVLLIEAFGDHQVANIGTETEARTIGADVRTPTIAAGRSNDVVPFWGIPAVPSNPFGGSVLELWDFGTPAPPTASVPPESPQYGSDPHGAARNVPAVQNQVSAFLQPNGTFVDVCGTAACHFP
jgi:hypothetical protein